jgi:CRP/FNR family transcriptional regulator, anaerobic regulatory protein
MLYYLSPGETCTMSFSCCLAHKRSEVRTVAEEDAVVIALPVEYVDRWMTKYPVWKNFVMRAYDERMQELVRTIDNIAFKKMDERLWEYLRMKAAQSSNSALEITHQQIAHDLFASREAVSRLLKKLEQEGRITLGRNTIVIKNL